MVELKRFFEDYKALKVKKFLDCTEAERVIVRAVELYRKNREQLIGVGSL